MDSNEEIDFEERVMNHESRLNCHGDLIENLSSNIEILSSFFAFRASAINGSNSGNKDPGM